MQPSKKVLHFNKGGYASKARLTSRYLVEKSYYLSSTRKILTIHNDFIELQSTNLYSDKNDQIEFVNIQSI